MQGLRRKVVHAVLYEALAIGIVTALMAAGGWASAGHGLMLSVVLSGMATVWNMAFNSLFEAWERRQVSRERTVRRRVLHALGFEFGLMLMTVPVIAWMLGMDWWTALATDIGLMLFFLGYTFVYNWAFDHVFGLPQ
jgi:uncharacterized membrane protein